MTCLMQSSTAHLQYATSDIHEAKTKTANKARHAHIFPAECVSTWSVFRAVSTLMTGN